MPLYKVKAATDNGRIIAREMEAESERDVTLKLEKDGLHPIEVRSGGGLAAFSKPIFRGGKGVAAAEFMVFNRGLIALLKAGIPIADGLDVLAQKAESMALRNAAAKALSGIRGGRSLSEAMSESPEVFPPLYTAAIGSGERTGDLVPALRGFLDYAVRMETLRKRIVRAVSLPLVLAGISFCVIIFLMLYVVPTFTKVYEGFGGELPYASKILFGASAYMQAYWMALCAAAAVAVFLFYAYFKSSSGKRVADKIKLGFPQLGDIYRGYAISKFSRTLSMVLRSGVTLVDSLGMAKGVLGNSVLENKLDAVIKKTREGGSVTAAMEEVAFMPEVTLRMFAVGEKTASLPDMLADIADYHNEEVDHRTQILANLIEPALMIIMGLVIGTVVLLLYLPIFQLGANI